MCDFHFAFASLSNRLSSPVEDTFDPAAKKCSLFPFSDMRGDLVRSLSLALIFVLVGTLGGVLSGAARRERKKESSFLRPLLRFGLGALFIE